MQELLSNIILRKQVIQNGLSTVQEKFSLSAMVESIVNVYQQTFAVIAEGSWRAYGGGGPLDGYYVDFVKIEYTISWSGTGDSRFDSVTLATDQPKGSSDTFWQVWNFEGQPDQPYGTGSVTVTLKLTMKVHWWSVWWIFRFGPYYQTDFATASATYQL